MAANTKPMTAADHLAQGERLLETAAKFTATDMQIAASTRAQAHFAAARLLIDADDSGLADIATERRNARTT